MTPNQRLATLIKAMRYSLNGEVRSQRDLAKLIGVSYTTVQNWEKGLFSPQEGSICKLASQLGWTLEDLQEYLDKGISPKSSDIERILLLIRTALPMSDVGAIAQAVGTRLAAESQVYSTAS